MAYPALIVMPISDIEKAKGLYRTLLGVDPYVDSPYYVGFRAGDREIGLDPNGEREGPLPYWDVEDIEAEIETLTAAGATVKQEPSEVGGGLTIAILVDGDGNRIGLRQSSR